jgi:hypothetical protein
MLLSPIVMPSKISFIAAATLGSNVDPAVRGRTAPPRLASPTASLVAAVAAASAASSFSCVKPGEDVDAVGPAAVTEVTEAKAAATSAAESEDRGVEPADVDPAGADPGVLFCC